MRGRGVILLGVLAWIASTTVACGEETRAEKIIQRYLKMSFEEEGRPGESWSARRAVLEQLKTMPDDAVPALAQTIADAKDPRQRRELTGVLSGYFQTQRVADLLCDLLKDPDEQVRGKAIHGLWMMARRTDRSGGKRISRRPEFEPMIEGLVPSLVAAADDTAEMNRVSAMYALADTRDPAAVAELRRRLDDSSPRVWLFAACFLTEYSDAQRAAGYAESVGPAAQDEAQRGHLILLGRRDAAGVFRADHGQGFWPDSDEPGPVERFSPGAPDGAAISVPIGRLGTLVGLGAGRETGMTRWAGRTSVPAGTIGRTVTGRAADFA